MSVVCDVVLHESAALESEVGLGLHCWLKKLRKEAMREVAGDRAVVEGDVHT